MPTIVFDETLLDVDQFTTLLSHIPGTPNPEEIFFRLSSSQSGTRFTYERVIGAARYPTETIEELRKRYTELFTAIGHLVSAGFTIDNLEIAEKYEMMGSRIDYKTPQRRKFSNQYFRHTLGASPSEMAERLIPDDFINDLKRILNQHT